MTLFAVMGPTASGKTALAEMIADRFDAVLINADAFQVYRGLDIGTAKPDDPSRYRLLDVKEPNENFGVGEFCILAAAELHRAYESGRSAVVVGGTGQYIRALTEEFKDLMPEPDAALRALIEGRLEQEGLAALAQELRASAPDLAATLDLANPVRVTRALERLQDPRPPLQFKVPYTTRKKIAILPEKVENDFRISQRVGRMMHNGWVKEVEALRARGFGPNDPGFRAIGYRTMIRVLDGDLASEEAERVIFNETVAYAKRQRTWLRSEPGLFATVSSMAQGLSEALTNPPN